MTTTSSLAVKWMVTSADVTENIDLSYHNTKIGSDKIKYSIDKFKPSSFKANI